MPNPTWSVVVDNGVLASVVAPLQGPLPNVLAEAAELGYEAVSLTVNRPLEIDVAGTRTLLQRHGLRVSAIATGRGYLVDGLSLGSGDESTRAAAVQRCREHVDLAAALGSGTKVVIGAIRGRVGDAASLEEHLAAFERSLAEVVAYAGERRIVVLLEAMNHLDADIVTSVPAAAELVRAAGSPWLRLQVDTYHMGIENEGPDVLPAYAQILSEVDLSGPDRACPVDGGYDFVGLFDVLSRIGFTEDLLLEHVPAPPADAAAAGLRYLRSLGTF